jgi:hypothetical protein
MGLLMWGALSDEWTGLSFTTASGPRQCSHFRVRVSWDSRQYLTVSDLRLPFLSLPATRRATVEVFELASTHLLKSKLCYDRRTVGKSVLVSSTHPGLTTRFFTVRQLRVC